MICYVILFCYFALFYRVFMLFHVSIYIPIRGKPTKLAPIPNPAPDRADTPMAGTYVSNTEKVAAAVKEINKTSSIFNERFGIAYAAIATIKPSTKYLTTRRNSSPKSNTSAILSNMLYNK